jgi:hypothetical protein
LVVVVIRGALVVVGAARKGREAKDEDTSGQKGGLFHNSLILNECPKVVARKPPPKIKAARQAKTQSERRFRIARRLGFEFFQKAPILCPP